MYQYLYTVSNGSMLFLRQLSFFFNGRCKCWSYDVTIETERYIYSI